MEKTDVLIIGAGASGLMCAIEAGKRSRKVIVIDHSDKPGSKILVSGGGRCNFTNQSVNSGNYLSHNPHFCKSALSRYSQWDFIDLVQRYDIPFHERSHGQLFCDSSSNDILGMLLAECGKANVLLRLSTTVGKMEKGDDGKFQVQTNAGAFVADSLVIATGGLSIPNMGATPFGYKVAEQFGIKVWQTSPGLVPLTLQPKDKERFAKLSGIAVPCIVSSNRTSFAGDMLFTHRGLSGPAILQVSSHWTPGEELSINLLPKVDLAAELRKAQQEGSQQKVKTFLGKHLPARLVSVFVPEAIAESPLQNVSHKQFDAIAGIIQEWVIKPNATEGYRTAEVTLGGVDCDELSSKTFECKGVPGLYFIGEVLDVTGWLGGYNLQWAWSSGWCAGQFV